MARFESVFEDDWSEASFGLRQQPQMVSARVAQAGPQTPDSFILPPQTSEQSVSEPATGTLADSVFEPVIPYEEVTFQRPIEETFFDVDGDGAVDKIAALLDPDYVPPILDLI